jgi:hypothetical protein
MVLPDSDNTRNLIRSVQAGVGSVIGNTIRVQHTSEKIPNSRLFLASARWYTKLHRRYVQILVDKNRDCLVPWKALV